MMNPVVACLYRRDESSLRRLLAGVETSSRLSQAHLDEGLRVVLSNKDTQDEYWTASRLSIAEMLLMAGANADLCIDEEPLICRMVRVPDVEMVMLLVFQFQCDIDARAKIEGEKDKTALHLAVEQCNEEIVQLLLSTGASANIGDKCGNRPLHVLLGRFCSSQSEHSTTSKKLQNLFSALLPLTDLTCANNEGYSVLHTAVACAAPSIIIEEILCTGINVNNRNASGETALILACKYGNLNAVSALLRIGCDTSVTTFVGDTAAHYAAMQSSIGVEIMKLLLEKDVDFDLSNNFGLLPIHMSIKSGNVGVTQLLILNNSAIEKIGILIYDQNRNIITLDNNVLNNSIYDTVSRYWNHLDFIELTMLVTAGCPVNVTTRDMIRQMAVDVNTKKPMNWRNSLYGIKKSYNLHTLLFAAEMLQKYCRQPSQLQHLCRLSLRKFLGTIHYKRHVKFTDIFQNLDIPNSMLNYVKMVNLNELQIPKSSS